MVNVVVVASNVTLAFSRSVSPESTVDPTPAPFTGSVTDVSIIEVIERIGDVQLWKNNNEKA